MNYSNEHMTHQELLASIPVFESLTPEVAPFGIRTLLVEPGFFRTELLTPESTSYASPSINDYAERTEQTVAAWNSMNGLQGGDPAKLAAALVRLASQDQPPLRWVAGANFGDLRKPAFHRRDRLVDRGLYPGLTRRRVRPRPS